MKYDFMAKAFWKVFRGGYEYELKHTLGITNTKTVMKKAHENYKKMVESIQPFEEKNRFISNLLLASILGGIYISLEEKPDIEKMIDFNREALMNNKVLLKSVVSERNYTEKGQKKLEEDARKSQQETNPYAWKFTYEKGETTMEYTVTFQTCGIWILYRMWDIQELTPAMCKLDYDMAWANNTEFIREQTLAGGGEYCDCHYKHTPKKKII